MDAVLSTMWMRHLIQPSSHVVLVAGTALEACAFSIYSLNDGSCVVQRMSMNMNLQQATQKALGITAVGFRNVVGMLIVSLCGI